PTLDGKSPVLFEADTENEIYRALRFSKEFGLKAMICGGLEAFKPASALGKEHLPVIAAVNFGSEPKKPDKPDAREADKPETALAEEHRLWDEKVANLKRLNDAAIPFALTTRGAQKPSDFWDNLRLAVKAGLPREAALRALTINPAKMFGEEAHLG